MVARHSDMTPEAWAASVLRRLGIRQTPGAMRAMVGWARAEGGHWNNDARYNPLNTTQPMAGAGNTGSQGNIKVYKDWDQGIQATVKTLENGHYGSILKALKHGDADGVAAAIGQTPWGTAGDLVARTIAGTPEIRGRVAPASLSSPPTQRRTTTLQIDTPELTESFDAEGYEKARRRAVVGAMIARRNPNSMLLTTGALSTQMPSESDFRTSDVTTSSETLKFTRPGESQTDAPSSSTPSASPAARAVAAAEKRLGIGESGGNNRGPKIDRWQQKYGMLGQPWCGIFVGLTLEHAGVRGINARVASVGLIEEDARAGRNGWASWQPATKARVGDALITARGQHVGLVVGVDGGTIHTIEGNTSTGRVERRTHSASDMYGVARPRYR